MDFRRGINLLIGDNSVGKTSLLRACNLVMNAFFCGYSDENTKWKSAEDDDFREIKNDDIVTDDQPVNIAFELDEIDCPNITLEDGSVIPLHNHETFAEEFGCPEFNIEKKSKKNARNLISGLVSLRVYASLLQKNSHAIVDGMAIQRNALPLFAYFTTEDIHTVRKFDKEKTYFKKYPQKPSFGYFESFDCKGLLDCWLKRILVLKEAKKGEQEIECVRNAVVSALGPNGCDIIADMEVRTNDNEVFFMYCDGREVRSDLLSDGYRRLVSIVVDIAFRSALLNKVMYGNEAYKYTHGTVIIDEIDEHLHPELQVRILKALHETFPKIQFIVSTHAPLVMSSVENAPENVVYKLEYNDGVYSHKELNTYGLDASTIMQVYMDLPPRDLAIDDEIKNIESLIDAEKYSDARTALEKMQERPGSDANPELSKIEATLSFFEE
jgi:predicted ATP-binding protein involved in virulence